jgi:hypothetical protein
METVAAASMTFDPGRETVKNRSRSAAGRTKGSRSMPSRASLREKYSKKGTRKGAARPAPIAALARTVPARRTGGLRCSRYAPARSAAIRAVSGWPPERTR